MILETKVKFYISDCEYFSLRRRINGLSDLKEIVQNYDLVIPRTVTLNRSVDVVKPQKKSPNRFATFSDNDKNTLNISNESVRFIVANKITVAADIQKYLKEKYNETMSFPVKENEPIVLDYVEEKHLTGMRVNNKETHYVLREIHWHCLGDKDIVVNKELQQIWPKKTGKMPQILVKFLKTKNENIRVK